ncbi:MAG: multidrug effflux MFS transporter [Neomegalonema sp.]|nr:multidrug effflux MFS transporter [Neomegalonema sp.]
MRPSPTETAPAAQSGQQRFLLIALLAGVTGLGPFALQAIAPSLPVLQEALMITKAQAQLFISLSTLAMAFGALFYGPLADHIGRRPVLIAGLVMSMGGALMAALAPGFALAITGRLIQAIGAGVGMVLSRAIARDLYGRDGAASVISLVTAFMVVAPMIAPILGGVLTEAFGWRSVFVAIAAIATGLLLWTWRSLHESLQTPSPRLDFRSVIEGYRHIAGIRVFWGYAGWSGFSLATFFLFVGGGPAMFHEAYGIGAAEYGLYFFAISGAYMMANFACTRVSRAIGAERAILLGSVLTIGGGILAAGILASGLGGPWTLMVAAMMNAAGGGIGQPNSLAGAISTAPERAGAASGLLSVVQFSLAAIGAQLAALLVASHVWHLPALMAVCSGIGLILYGWLREPARD